MCPKEEACARWTTNKGVEYTGCVDSFYCGGKSVYLGTIFEYKCPYGIYKEGKAKPSSLITSKIMKEKGLEYCRITSNEQVNIIYCDKGKMVI
jgi:hypothetical protein